MNVLLALQNANPNLRLYSVFDPAFRPYGQVLRVRDAALFDAIRRTPIPESGNCYVASDPALEALDAVREIGRTVYGGMPIEAGFCNGRGFTLNAEEYHKCSEVNCSTTGLVLLLALPEDVHERTLDSKDVKGFYLPPETPVEIYPRVLHFAPCRSTADGFNCLVILTRGTNTPLDAIDTTADGEQGLLWMQNKWLLCHPDSPQAQKGAFVGIRGENLRLLLG
ncbi:MAG: DUF4867 family protein [Clostridia bacterium]|nr:DUF4867 family protein [Clostridia bacterium]